MAISPKQVVRGSRPAKKKALLIGISYKDSKTHDKLNMPHEDVMKLREFLIKEYGYTQENITVMLDKPGELQPTQKNIRQQASKLVAGAGPGDHFFFYYAGHSVQVPENRRPEDRMELDGLDEVIVPLDGHTADHRTTRESCLVDDELNLLLVDPLPPKTSFMAILDTCHSASLLDLNHDECNIKGNCLNSLQSKTIVSSYGPQSRPVATNKPPVRSSPVRRPEHDAVSRTTCRRTSSGKPQRHRACARIPYIEKRVPGAFHSVGYESPIPEPSHVPLVISLSACRDDQITVENLNDKHGRSFTERLLRILRADPHPRLRDLMKKIGVSIHKMLRDAVTLEQLNKPQARGSHKLHNHGLRCQDPQISSDSELDMESHLETL
ncbi:peptidase C14, caspase domain-containing protein [Mycena galopus ATCC 62051]|nr:peptidase C14, caspase domain-containing protein [Mycena galopus ATCC 62051]